MIRQPEPLKKSLTVTPGCFFKVVADLPSVLSWFIVDSSILYSPGLLHACIFTKSDANTICSEKVMRGELAIAFFNSKMNKKFNCINTCMGRILPMKDTSERKASCYPKQLLQVWQRSWITFSVFFAKAVFNL